MKKTRYILPVLISTRLLSQQDQEKAQQVEFGFSNGIFTSITGNPVTSPINTFRRGDAAAARLPAVPMTQTTVGFNYGLFLWVKVNDRISIRPELDASFSNYRFEDRLRRQKDVYATSIDLAASNQVVINLKPVNTHGMIRAAKCMSYYLTSKQPYVLVGPKVSYKKFDRGFIQKGFENESTMGVVVGYGVNYGFHNMNFAPEIKYSLETSTQNTVYGNRKVIHTITLSINLF